MQERSELLRYHSRALPLEADVDLEDIAKRCHGFSGADIAALCRTAAMNAIFTTFHEGSNLCSEGAVLFLRVTGCYVDSILDTCIVFCNPFRLYFSAKRYV
jgi:SpoVK/Ycf46/Vps4 family AAA+-type ATPase